MSLAFWVKFETGKPGCIEAFNESEALALGTKIAERKAVSAKRIPYPAEPRLNLYEHRKYGPRPSFCYQLEKC